MIGQRDSQAEEVDKGGDRTPWLKKEELKKRKKGGGYKNVIVQE